MQSAKANSHLS